MTFDIDIDGEPRSISVEPAGPGGGDGRFRVRINGGDAADVDVRVTDLGLSLVYPATGRVVDVALTERAGSDWLVQLPHVSLTATVDGRRRPRGTAGSAAATGDQRIVAPMPGRIVRVLVKTGDEVAARQGLVVVEAMKMENELSAGRAGRIKEIAVTEGVSVDAGRLLVVVE
jgi:biotin carboxyl carrier protein